MKNYYIYDDNGTLKRQVIHIHDNYACWKALQEIPASCNVIARIILSKNTDLVSAWQKHNLITNYSSYDLWKVKQDEFKRYYINLLSLSEQMILSTL